MSNKYNDIDPQETTEWLESIEDALENHGTFFGEILGAAARISLKQLKIPNLLLLLKK